MTGLAPYTKAFYDPKMKMGDYNFDWICDLEPFREAGGLVRHFTPQSRYRNEKALSLHRYGGGPFCKFKIPRHHHRMGVYSLFAYGDLRYVGECQNLSARFNAGYGNISPRNCFAGGQQSNCRINNLIFDALRQGAVLKLWFFETEHHKSIERELRLAFAPPWNLV